MKYFKKEDGSIWAFEEDGSQDHLITSDMISYEYIPIDDSKIIKKNEIDLKLIEIDKESIRPLRAFASGTQMDFDVHKLQSLEIEAAELREERSNL